VSIDGVRCTSLRQWFVRSFPKRAEVTRRSGESIAVERLSAEIGQAAVLRCNGTNVRLGIAPDLPTARALVA
jgi:hypothetical protein